MRAQRTQTAAGHASPTKPAKEQNLALDESDKRVASFFQPSKESPGSALKRSDECNYVEAFSETLLHMEYFTALFAQISIYYGCVLQARRQSLRKPPPHTLSVFCLFARCENRTGAHILAVYLRCQLVCAALEPVQLR